MEKKKVQGCFTDSLEMIKFIDGNIAFIVTNQDGVESVAIVPIQRVEEVRKFIK